MAQRRMFSMKVIDTDMFLDMSPTAQSLYFHLAMRADDDGFVASPKKIIKMVNAADDDMRILIAKKYVLPFESGICVIRDWKIHNYIQADRYCETEYKQEKKMLSEKDGKYEVETECIQNVSIMDTQVRLGKKRLGKERKENTASPSDACDKVLFDAVDMEMATLLRDRIRENIPTLKEPNMDQWAKHVRLMRERDKRTPDQIRYLIDWAQKSTFWQANILSTAKLREKFDMLVAQAKRTHNERKEKAEANYRGIL